MEVRLNEEHGPPVAPRAEILVGLNQKLQQEQALWQQRVRADPHHFADVEVAVPHTFQQMADQVLAGLLAELGHSGALETPCKKSP